MCVFCPCGIFWSIKQNWSELPHWRHLVHLTFQNIHLDTRAVTLSADPADRRRQRPSWRDNRQRNVLYNMNVGEGWARPKACREVWRAWVTLTWFSSRKEGDNAAASLLYLHQVHIPLGTLHQPHNNLPCTTASHGVHCRDQTQTELLLTANQRGRNPSGCLVERKRSEREQKRVWMRSFADDLRL